MFVMHYREVERYFEILADTIEKKDGYKNFYEQLGKFLKRATYANSTNQTKDIGLVRFGNPKPGDELNRPKGAQVVENGWWLSRNDRRLKFGSTEARAREGPRFRSSKMLTMPVCMIVNEADEA